MIRVTFRHDVPPGTERAFVEAWLRCKTKILERAKGARGATLLRSRENPREYLTETRWESEADWRAYWSSGRVADPNGETSRNVVFDEVETIAR